VIGYEDIEYASQTDVGVRRSHNQDAYAALPASDAEQWRGRGHVFLVADGMGAHAVGELASKLAADSIPHIYSKHSREGPVAALRKAFIETNLSIHTRGQQNREFEGMGTTATAVLLRPEGAWIGHVGDSRAYRVRDGRIEQLSFDHSLVWELARRQRKDPAELQGIPSNVIVRSLGPEPLVQVDVEGPHPVQPGDYFVLCSDGLSGPVSDREIGAIVSALPPPEACRFLVHLANLQGGPDNITAIVVRVGKPEGGAASVNGRKPPRVSRDPGKPPFSQTLGQTLKRVWPFVLLFLGIGLSSLSLTIHQLPGLVMVPFLLAIAALIAGVFGLILQTRQEKSQTPEETYVPRTRVYRQTPCAIDHALVERMARAVSELEERIHDRNWQADWDKSRAERELAEEQRQRGDYLEAFRGYCHAMMTLMNAVQQQRAKEEVFKPLWDSMQRGSE
jgi:protein phosphatase